MAPDTETHQQVPGLMIWSTFYPKKCFSHTENWKIIRYRAIYNTCTTKDLIHKKWIIEHNHNLGIILRKLRTWYNVIYFFLNM